jgi:hypothetical protein
LDFTQRAQRKSTETTEKNNVVPANATILVCGKQALQALY